PKLYMTPKTTNPAMNAAATTNQADRESGAPAGGDWFVVDLSCIWSSGAVAYFFEIQHMSCGVGPYSVYCARSIRGLAGRLHAYHDGLARTWRRRMSSGFARGLEGV